MVFEESEKLLGREVPLGQKIEDFCKCCFFPLFVLFFYNLRFLKDLTFKFLGNDIIVRNYISVRKCDPLTLLQIFNRIYPLQDASVLLSQTSFI